MNYEMLKDIIVLYKKDNTKEFKKLINTCLDFCFNEKRINEKQKLQLLNLLNK